ncbi:MAG: phosphotriesterase, partial [bacterium]|nr:phosphotriesterase [bacterium]
GLKIITNTGYYGAAKDRYIPDHARRETADQLAARWVHEWRHGIDGSGIRPGFMKIGVDGGALSEIDAKLVRAAAMAHRDTGLTMAIHTGESADSVRGQLKILREEGVAPSAWIWVHAHKVEDPADLVRVAGEGGWVELDGVSAAPADIARHLELIGALRKAGHWNRVLLSHDGNSFRYGGKPMKPYDGLFTHFIPAMKKAGYDDEQIRQVTVLNPREAFQVARRS